MPDTDRHRGDFLVRLSQRDRQSSQRSIRTQPCPHECIRRIVQIRVIVDVREDTRDVQAGTAPGGHSLSKRLNDAPERFLEFFDALVTRIHTRILRLSGR